ncbi:twin-arginine translocation signal domain-containing protein [Methylogaea oryzae]|uniref:twin-arginine translocation signal domain-containing protein n=1 Tax=Methylogaea oryzae TaxID=1295382 RepID=UPI0026E50BFE|nr:twin-arginine translocation signal domain-containing protein [Methylogaea oryzae]
MARSLFTRHQPVQAGRRDDKNSNNPGGRMSDQQDSFYAVMRRQGITRRSFLKYCSLTASAMALGPQFVGQIAHAMETKPRTPVLWLHGLECTCCSESFIRSAHPLAKDVYCPCCPWTTTTP